jgi:putative hydrolase of HD superfamily
MQTEKAPLTLPAINGQVSAAVTAWFEILHLKQVFRKGWLERGLPPARCESVAEHSFGNAMLCLLLAQQQPGLNVEKILRMALIHDLGEVYVGDLTPTDAVDPQEKYAMEKQAVLKILSGLTRRKNPARKLGGVRGPSHARSPVCQTSRPVRVCPAGGPI